MEHAICPMCETDILFAPREDAVSVTLMCPACSCAFEVERPEMEGDSPTLDPRFDEVRRLTAVWLEERKTAPK